MLTSELNPESLVGALERYFGSKRGCDISGTTTDMFACFELWAAYKGRPLTLVHKLTPVIVLSRLYHHTILECAIPLMVCYPEIDYIPGYYPSLLPKNLQHTDYTGPGVTRTEKGYGTIIEILLRVFEWRRKKQTFVLIFSNKWRSNFAMHVFDNATDATLQVGGRHRSYFSIQQALSLVQESEYKITAGADDNARTIKYRSVCAHDALVWPANHPDHDPALHEAYHTLQFLLKNFHSVRNYMQEKIGSDIVKDTYGGRSDFLPVAMHLLMLVPESRDNRAARLDIFVVELYNWSTYDDNTKRDAKNIVCRFLPKGHTTERIIKYITDVSKGFAPAPG